MHKTRIHTREFLLLLLVWMLLMYIGSFLLLKNYTAAGMRYININNGLFGLINFAQFYIYLRWIVTPFLQNRNWKSFAGKLLPVFAAFIIIKYAIAAGCFPGDLLYRGYRIENRQRVDIYTTVTEYAISSLWSGVLVVLAAFFYRFFIWWLAEDKRRAILQKQQLQAESGFLKMQLNSHFLINSLNSIYSLALMGSPEVVRANKTLTDLLSYMVDQPSDIDYRGPVAAEIRYLEDFVTLQRIRTGCEAGVVFNIPAQLPDKQIAPLLLVPFVENAFKHGVSNRPEMPVTITLECSEAQLVFRVHNHISGHQRDKTGGIGLDNVKKRLQLIYPGRHQLEIRDLSNEYYSNLVINW